MCCDFVEIGKENLFVFFVVKNENQNEKKNISNLQFDGGEYE